jgi:dGTPase
MAPFGGFDHNAQALKIVTRLEAHYADFDGLNLTWETLEGIAKHNGPVTGEIPFALAEYNVLHDLELDTHASAEAQVAAISDDIAYNNHDLADGLRAGLFDLEDLRALPLIGPCIAAVDARWPGLEPSRREHEALRRFFGLLVEDVLATSRARLAEAGVGTAGDVRCLGRPVIRFSDATFAELKVIREFLFHRMYRHWTVQRMRRKAATVVRALFEIFTEAPHLMPQGWNAGALDCDTTTRARIVADYIAGMTDRFALQEHAKLTDPMVKG